MEWLNLKDSVNLLSIIGSLAILAITFFVVGLYFKQMKNKPKEDSSLSKESWDGIKEFKNPLPIGWALAFVGTIIWALWYFLLGYPLNSYSQIGAYNEEVRASNAEFEKLYTQKDLAHNLDLLKEMGQSIYLNYCAACHGITGDGIDGFAADLRVWGSEEGILNVVKHGSRGLNFDLGDMPGGLVEGEDALAVSAYVAKELSSIKSTSHMNLVSRGKEIYLNSCAACHGEDGKGMDGLAPNLTQYGSADFVQTVLARGKKGDIGDMPAFNFGRLNDIQKKAVGEYVISLSKEQ